MCIRDRAEDDLSWAHQLQTYVDQYARESGKSFEVSLFADGEDLLLSLIHI